MKQSIFTIAFVFLCAATAPVAAQTKKPNVLFILVDDMGWRDLACYGHEIHETPNIDGLASRGMRFTNAYAACAVCSPTRAAIQTGRYPGRTGVTDWIRCVVTRRSVAEVTSLLKTRGVMCD